MAEERRGHNQQDPPSGEVRFQITRGGEVRRMRGGDEEAEAEVQLGEPFIVARLEGKELDVRIGQTAVIGGERLLNREFTLTDKDALAAIKDALLSVLDESRHLPERALQRDALSEATVTPELAGDEEGR
jgi:hypothetical protein